jgi:hypothetical protein
LALSRYSRLISFSHEGSFDPFVRSEKIKEDAGHLFWVEAPAFMAGVRASDKIQRFSAGGRFSLTIKHGQMHLISNLRENFFGIYLSKTSFVSLIKAGASTPNTC